MLRVPAIGRQSGAPAGRKREPFSPQDDALIVEFLAAENPSGENRKGNELWKRLEKNASKQWPRGPAHTAQSWRNRYVHDAATFDARVVKFIKNARAKRKAERALEAETHNAKRRKLDVGQQQEEQQRGNGITQVEESVNGVEAMEAEPVPAETVVNGHASPPNSRMPSPSPSGPRASVTKDREAPPQPAPEPEPEPAPAPPPAPKAAPPPSRPSLTAFRGARKSVTDLPAMAVASASGSSSNSTGSRSSGRSATSGKKSASIQSGDASAEEEESATDESRSAREASQARSRSASIRSQDSDFSQHEAMPGAFTTRRTRSPPHSQPLYPKLSSESDAALAANEPRSRELSTTESRPRQDLSDHRSSKSSRTGRQAAPENDGRAAEASVVPPKVNGSRAVPPKHAQVYDDDTEEDEPPPAASRKTTSARVLVSRDPFSNRRMHVGSGPARSPSLGTGNRAEAAADDGESDKGEAAADDDGNEIRKAAADDDDDDMDYPVGPSANKGKGRAVDDPITTDPQHEASAGNVADVVAAPMEARPTATAESSPASSAPQSSPIERRLARSSSSAGAAAQPTSSKAQLPPLRPRPSFSKPRDAPSPFASPNATAPNGLFVRRSEARDLMRPGPERATKSSPVKPAYSLNAVPALPGKRRRETTVEDDTPTTNGRHVKPAREFVVPQLPASVSMPLPSEPTQKEKQGHRRRQTFGGFPALDLDLDAIPDAGALLRSRERERRRSTSVRLSSGSVSMSPHPRPEDERARALRRMSDNHGFAPAIVRGVLAGAGDDLGAADAVLARMRREAEREAVRALGEIVGEDFEVETSPAPVDVSLVPEVDFSGMAGGGSGHRLRRRTTGRWAESVEQEEGLVDDDYDAMEEDEEYEDEGEEEEEEEEDIPRTRFLQEPWTAEEDRMVLTASASKLKAIDARRGVGAVAERLAQLL